MFGAQPAPGGQLFGGNQQPAGGGLFGSTPQPAGGLNFGLGATQTGNALGLATGGGGMFGGGIKPQQPLGGQSLFGG